MLLVEQNTRLALAATQRVYLIEKGVIKHEGALERPGSTTRRCATATSGCETGAGRVLHVGTGPTNMQPGGCI